MSTVGLAGWDRAQPVSRRPRPAPSPRRSWLHRFERWRLQRRIREIERALAWSHRQAAAHSVHAVALSGQLARAWLQLTKLDSLP